MLTDHDYVNAYRKHKHLKNAADELGITFQKLYVNLRRIGEPVTGDKYVYASGIYEGEFYVYRGIPDIHDICVAHDVWRD